MAPWPSRPSRSKRVNNVPTKAGLFQGSQAQEAMRRMAIWREIGIHGLGDFIPQCIPRALHVADGGAKRRHGQLLCA